MKIRAPAPSSLQHKNMLQDLLLFLLPDSLQALSGLNSLQTRYSVMEIFHNNPSVVIYQATYFLTWRGRRLTFSEHVNKMRSCLLQQWENYVPCQFLNIELPGCVWFLECNFISIFTCLKDTKVTSWRCTKRTATPDGTPDKRHQCIFQDSVWCVLHKSWTTIINHILIYMSTICFRTVQFMALLGNMWCPHHQEVAGQVQRLLIFSSRFAFTELQSWPAKLHWHLCPYFITIIRKLNYN